MKKGVLLIFGLFILFGFMGVVSATEITDITKVSGKNPFVSYYSVSNDLILVYGVEGYEQGNYVGAPYYFFVDTVTGERQEINIPSNEAWYPNTIVTKDYVIFTDTLNKRSILYNIQNKELEFSLEFDSLASASNPDGCDSREGQFPVLSSISFLSSESENLFYIAISSCQMEEDGMTYDLGKISQELYALSPITRESVLLTSLPTPLIKIISIDSEEIYFTTITDNGKPVQERIAYGNLFRYNFSSNEEATSLLSEISGAPLMKKEGDLFIWEKLTPDFTGNQVKWNLEGFSYYNLFDESTGDLDVDLSSEERGSFVWDFSEEKIVWTSIPTFSLKSLFMRDNKIFIYDISSGELSVADAGKGIKSLPLIEGNRLFWAKLGNNFLAYLLRGKHPDVVISFSEF